MSDYVILSTACGNVGDRLITESAKEIIRAEKGDVSFTEYFREENLESCRDALDQARAIIMPGFAIRDPIYPETYCLTSKLEEIEKPLVPMGAGWKAFPGDSYTLANFRYSSETTDFLRWLSHSTPVFGCREYFTIRILKDHGIGNTLLVGDCAWYDQQSLGKPMRRPANIHRLVFTTPHSCMYDQQAAKILDMLANLFPHAERFCVLQSGVAGERKELLSHARENNFVLVQTRGELGSIAFYAECDLHVGYRVHGHIAFLRQRIPSILLHEDGRGVGFTHTLTTGGFNAFSRLASDRTSVWSHLNRGFRPLQRCLRGAVGRQRTTASGRAYPDPQLPKLVEAFLREELETRFRRYIGISRIIDETYELGMRKLVRLIP